MKIALILFDDFEALSMLGLYEPIAALAHAQPALKIQISTCAMASQVRSASGLQLTVDQAGGSLEGYTWLLVPGGPGAFHASQNPDLLDWLGSSSPGVSCAAVAEGITLLEAANLPRISEYIATEPAEAHTLGRNLAGYLASNHSPQDTNRAVASEPAAHRLPRRAVVARRTKETEIRVELNLDGSGDHQISTGIGFLDHMLTHLAVHGLFDLQITAQGDLQVDVHHTLEDVALTLGKAFSQALGERQGIVRTASQYVPMDEALAFVAIDLSGRPYAVLQAGWHAPETGTIPNSLWAHFLESFAVTAGCNLHARLLYGRDDHHQAEALFKALGRALQVAVQRDPRRQLRVPSTKGTLVA